LSGGTLLRYALVGIGLLCAMVVASGTIKLASEIRAIGSGGSKSAVTAKAEWSNASGPKRRKDPYRPWL
jgi:hypothetical protein